jgi:hypothetical protein
MILLTAIFGFGSAQPFYYLLLGFIGFLVFVPTVVAGFIAYLYFRGSKSKGLIYAGYYLFLTFAQGWIASIFLNIN